MKTTRKFTMAIAITTLSIFLISISATQSKADMFGAVSADIKYQNSKIGDVQQVKLKSLAKLAAFAVGFVAGVGAGLTEGWAACGVLVDALDGQEKLGAFHNLNYNSLDLSDFDLVR
jgi:hypothetical protein